MCPALVRICLYCDKDASIVFTLGSLRLRAFAPGGRPTAFCLPYHPTVVVALSAPDAKKTVYYRLPCPAPYTLRLTFFSSPPATKQTFSLRDKIYGLPLDGELSFQQKRA